MCMWVSCVDASLPHILSMTMRMDIEDAHRKEGARDELKYFEFRSGLKPDSPLLSTGEYPECGSVVFLSFSAIALHVCSWPRVRLTKLLCSVL